MNRIIIRRTDLTKIKAEAIVNPANSSCIMGGGVAWHIKKAGGNVIEEEAVKQAPVSVGKAILTTAGRLPSKYVIHAPTMERPAMKISPENVRLAVRAALNLAVKKGIKTIAFPGMGTGVGGVSPSRAAKVMIEEIKKTTIPTVYLVDINEEVVNAFNRYAKD